MGGGWSTHVYNVLTSMVGGVRFTRGRIDRMLRFSVTSLQICEDSLWFTPPPPLLFEPLHYDHYYYPS